MKYRVYTKYWLENSIGEQTDGPWVPRGLYDTREEAQAEATRLKEWGTSGGTWVRVEEEPEVRQ